MIMRRENKMIRKITPIGMTVYTYEKNLKKLQNLKVNIFHITMTNIYQGTTELLD